MIKESCNLIEQEEPLTTSNQKRQGQMLPSLGSYILLKNLKYQLIPCKDIDIGRILDSIQSNASLATPNEEKYP